MLASSPAGVTSDLPAQTSPGPLPPVLQFLLSHPLHYPEDLMGVEQEVRAWIKEGGLYSQSLNSDSGSCRCHALVCLMLFREHSNGIISL